MAKIRSLAILSAGGQWIVPTIFEIVKHFLRYFKLLSVISVKLRLIKPFVNVLGKKSRVEYTPTRSPVTYRSERYGKPNELKLL